MRTENDEWDITSSVGVTALGVASGRAMETHRDDGLVEDPWAEAFVEAADMPVEMPTRPVDDETWASASTYIGVRSRFFDDYFTRAVDAGLRQVVILASGLDTRAQRLTWPEGTRVFEIDQRAVLDFKDAVLAEQDAPTAGGGAERVLVRVDLRQDWPAALRDAGFDPAAPTAWLAEGLLPYLPAQAEAELFARVHELSAPGSRIAVEHFGESIAAVGDDEEFATMSARWGMDVRELFFDDARDRTPEQRLDDGGWTVTGSSAADLARSYGRPLEPERERVFGSVVLLEGRLGGS